MSTDVLYPLLIGAGCLAVVIVVHLLTRPKPTRADITVPSSSRSIDSSGARPAESLSDWHRDNEAVLLDFIDHIDETRKGDEPPEIAVPAELSAEFEDAIAAHPSPEMQAELAALRASAEAMASAHNREDDDAVERHAKVYDEYREAWLDRLWQFPTDRTRVAALRGSRDG